MNYDALQKMIEEHEGFVPHVYKDSRGFDTIGFGWLIDKRKGGLSKERARGWLAQDILALEALLYNRILVNEGPAGADWYNALADARRQVLVDMAWNLGTTGLLRFRKTFEAIRAGDFELASKRMLRSRWARQVGRRARRLAEMMRTGQPVALEDV